MESNSENLPLSHQIWAWFEQNKTQAAWGAGIIVVLGTIVGFYAWRQGENDKQAGEALSSVIMSQMGNPAGHAPTAEAYLKVAADYPKSGAGAQALLLAASALFVEGKYADAKTQFDRYTREYRDTPLIPQAQLGAAACLEAQGKTNDAITAYKGLIDRRPNESVTPHARFSLARLYLAQNEPEKARPLFEEVAQTDPFSMGDEAKMQLAELQTKYPNLAAPASGPTNPAPYKIEKR